MMLTQLAWWTCPGTVQLACCGGTGSFNFAGHQCVHVQLTLELRSQPCGIQVRTCDIGWRDNTPAYEAGAHVQQ